MATAPDTEKNATVYAELVQLFHDTSLSLVIKAIDDGKKALTILHKHFMGVSKPRIIIFFIC